MPTSNTDLAMSLRNLYAPIRENPYEKRAKIVGGMIPHTGLASPALGYVMGKEMSNAEDWDVQRETEGKAAQESGLLAYKDRTQQEEASKILDFVAKVIDKDPDAANQILKAKTKTNKFLEGFKDINIGPTEDGWTMLENKKTGEMGQFNKQMFLWQVKILKEEGKENDPNAMEEVRGTFYKVIGAGAEKDNLPYKVGARHQYSRGAQKFEGTFKGLDKDNEPIWGDEQRVKETAAPEDKQGKVGIYNLINDAVASDWASIAVKNAKAQDIEDIKKEFSDPLTGKYNWQKVRSYLTPENQADFDKHVEYAQKYGRTDDPMAAAKKGWEGVLQDRQGKISKPAAAASPTVSADTVTIEGKQYKEGDIYTDKAGKKYKVRIKQ